MVLGFSFQLVLCSSKFAVGDCSFEAVHAKKVCKYLVCKKHCVVLSDYFLECMMCSESRAFSDRDSMGADDPWHPTIDRGRF